MKNEPETLETDLKELMRLVRKINALEQGINEKYGVRMIAGVHPRNDRGRNRRSNRSARDRRNRKGAWQGSKDEVEQ